MRERLKTLRHLLDVYETIEEMRLAEAQRATGEVHEAERAVGSQHAMAQEASLDERQALAEGDSMGRSFATTRQQVAGARRSILERVLREREEHSNAAKLRHVDSRQWSERMKQLVEGVEAGVLEQEEKRAQAMADDRYLSRRRWKRRERSGDVA